MEKWYKTVFGRRWNTVEVLTGRERNPHLMYIDDLEIKRYYISRDQKDMRKGWMLDAVKRFDLETFHFDRKLRLAECVLI